MRIVLPLVLLFLLPALVLANGEDDHTVEVGQTIEEEIKGTSITLIFWGSLLLGLLILIALLHKNKGEREKKLLFGLIVVSVVVVTAYVMGSTIYLNTISVTGGPVHWHADFEVWNCGERLDLTDPTGFENRVGSSMFHEHGDDRIHVEGVVVDYDDVTLHRFFELAGGDLTNERLVYPTTTGVVDVSNGDLCNGQPGTLQAFLYRLTNPDPTKRSGFVAVQEKLDDIAGYVPAPYSNIPPGDCIIIEFTEEDKPSTENICTTYRIAIERGDLTLR